MPDPVTPSNRFAMRGYQADIDGRNRYTGQNYEEKGRLFIATRGELTHVVGGRKPMVLANLAGVYCQLQIRSPHLRITY